MAENPTRCALCRNERPLRGSHFIPAGVYRILREQEERPYRMDDDGTFQDDRQIRAPLLCDECEQRFNKGGENWFLQNCAQPSGFRLHSLLTSAIPEAQGRLLLYRAAQIPEIDIEALVYFALSLYWRASVRTWRLGKTEYRPIHLGPYEEDLRKFLLDERQFPEHAALWVSVQDKLTPYKNLVQMPHDGGERGRYKVLVLGVMFDFFVSRTLPICLMRSFQNRIRDEKRNTPTLAASRSGDAYRS